MARTLKCSRRAAAVVFPPALEVGLQGLQQSVQREVGAALNVYGVDAESFDADAIDLASTFAAYAGVALANMHLYEAQGRVAEQLQTAMASRAVIEQAKGILMGARRCSPEEAFDILVRLSQDSNRKLREVAQALVDEARSAGEGSGS
jgi:GAF domain-containing protein